MFDSPYQIFNRKPPQKCCRATLTHTKYLKLFYAFFIASPPKTGC